MEGFRIDLKTIWAWLCLTNTPKLSEKKYQAFWGWYNYGPKSPKPSWSLYLVLLYYMIDAKLQPFLSMKFENYFIHHWNSASIKQWKRLINSNKTVTYFNGRVIYCNRTVLYCNRTATYSKKQPTQSLYFLSWVHIHKLIIIIMCKYISIIWRIIGAVSIILGIIGKKKEKFQKVR